MPPLPESEPRPAPAPVRPRYRARWIAAVVCILLLGTLTVLIVLMKRPPTTTPPANATANTASPIEPPEEARLLKEVKPIPTISPAWHWCMVYDIGDISLAAGDDTPLTPEILARERFVAQPLAGEWFVLLHADAASMVDGATAQPGQIKTSVAVDPTGRSYVTIDLPRPLALQLGTLTAPTNFQLAIVLDGKVLMAPTVASRLSNRVMLTGFQAREDAEWVAARIRDHPSSLRLQRMLAPGELANEEELRAAFRNRPK